MCGNKFRRITAFSISYCLIASTVAGGAELSRGDINAGKALVYLIQSEGSRRFLFSDQEWLGVVDKNAYTFTHLQPGEHFIWTDGGRAYGAVFFGAGSTNYLEISTRNISVLSKEKGEAMLRQTTTYSESVVADRRKSYKILKQYRKVRRRAAKAGMFEPCRFAKEKRREFEKRAAAGDIEATHIIGNLYWHGECVQRDSDVAMDWYRKAAESGHNGAAVTLGNIHHRGQIVTRDPAEAAKWYRMAAERGNLFAQRRLAEMYQQGVGVEQNTTEAIRWYRKAALENDDQWALTRLVEIDPEIQERKRLQALAEARETEKENERRRQRRQRIRNKRLDLIRNKYPELGLVFKPLQGGAKLEQPSRKKPTDSGAGWDSSIAYMLPPEVALGVVALGMVFNAIEKTVDSRLSENEKQLINDSATDIVQILSRESVARELRRHILDSARLTEGGSLFTPVDLRDGSEQISNALLNYPAKLATVVEVETSGIGLVLAEKRYRPSRFVMATRLRILRGSDGTASKERLLCYASKHTPEFSAWAADGGKQLRAELDTAYSSTAETLLLILAGEAYNTSTENTELCNALKETVERRLETTYENDR